MDRPTRVLQIVGGLNHGGIEVLLMSILRGIDRRRFQTDILIHSEDHGVYGDEALALGSRVIPCPDPSRPWVYSRGFRCAVREFGPYDVVHSHVYFYSGFIMHLARGCGIPKRIAHCHNDRADMESRAGLARRIYAAAMRRLVARDATIGLGVSRGAARNMFGPGWESDGRWRVVHCGIDLSEFRNTVDSGAVRCELGIPQSALVIASAARFVHAKNHAFILKVAQHVAEYDPNFRLLLIGDGPLRPEVEQEVAETGLLDRTIFTGMRLDVRRLLLGAIDILLMPSFHEGLPVVLMEAQAANVPCVISDVITDELDVNKELIHRVSLSRPAAEWAETVMQMGRSGSPIDAADALDAMKASPFNVESGIRELEAIYES